MVSVLLRVGDWRWCQLRLATLPNIHLTYSLNWRQSFGGLGGFLDVTADVVEGEEEVVASVQLHGKLHLHLHVDQLGHQTLANQVIPPPHEPQYCMLLPSS